MKNRGATVLALASLLILSACGGGGNESGPADAIEPSLSTVTVGQPGVCYVGAGPLIHLYGGTPPYQLSNSLPQGLQLSRDTVQNSGDAFRIDFIGGICMSGMTITIEDRMGRLARVTVNNGV